jgi:hypothetical protein
MVFITLFGLVVSPSFALEGSFGFQGGFAQGFLSGGQKLDPSFGPTAYASLDFKIIQRLSLGVGVGFTGFQNGANRIYVDGTQGILRFEPFGPAEWTPYLFAGAGFRPFYEAHPSHRWWAGDFQGSAGLGLRRLLDKGIALDVTAFYDLNSPFNNVLNSIGVRAGLAFPFGGGDSDSGKSTQVSSATIETTQTGAYEVHKGDTLWKISKHKAYGKGHEWKKIYDANQASIKDPNLIYPKQAVEIPSAEK